MSFLLVYCSDKHETQRRCDKSVDNSLAALRLIPDWFVKSRMSGKLYTALYADQNILYSDEGSGNALFSCKEMGILNMDIKNINLDNNFDADDPDTIILIRLWLGILDLKNTENFKKR